MTNALRHTYFDASDNLAQYLADQCGRQAITVAEVYADDRLCDETLYTVNLEDAQMGIDGWRTVTLDMSTKPNDPMPYFVENASGTRSKAVSADFVVFISKKVLQKNDIEIPESFWDAVHRYMKTGVGYLESRRLAAAEQVIS